ncbi:hypothetical protein [Haloarchaeobius sp. TZWWS8]|uniref:hypothetical protein n=1 Tax=Haloarchaeobius sp. TZWWS8 TaxID=3446121 RepID=UPI003EBE2644
MRRTSLATILVVVVVALAGCAGGLTGGDSTEKPSRSATSPQTTTADTDTPTRTTTKPYTPTATPTATAVPTTAAYSEPRPVNRPFQEAETGTDHLKSAKIVNEVDADGDGAVSDFDIYVTGNTSWDNVDPVDAGDARGEPFLIVEINGEYVERTDYTDFDENMEYTIDVHPGGLKQFEDGELDVKVYLLDQDKKHDDIFGTWSTTVEYEQEESSGNESAVASN